MPAKQTRLLQLWDELGVPHVERKQEWGERLTIIGFEVDPNAMTITMPSEARADLMSALRSFAILGRRRPLRDFQRISGWVNWGLNTFPLLRPGLSMTYDKMSGKCHPHRPIWINTTMRDELRWTADHIERSDSIHILLRQFKYSQ